MWPVCCFMCDSVLTCCTMSHFISASLTKPVSSSAPSGTSTSAPGCAPSSMRPSTASSVSLPRTRPWMDAGHGEGGCLRSSLPGRHPHPPCRPRRPHYRCPDSLRGLLARCATPVVPLPPRGSAQTPTLSMPKTLTFSMPIDSCRVGQISGLEQQQTTDGPQGEKGRPGGCTQPKISDPKHGQLATPLDGPGRRVSGIERS